MGREAVINYKRGACRTDSASAPSAASPAFVRFGIEPRRRTTITELQVPQWNQQRSQQGT